MLASLYNMEHQLRTTAVTPGLLRDGATWANFNCLFVKSSKRQGLSYHLKSHSYQPNGPYLSSIKATSVNGAIYYLKI